MGASGSHCTIPQSFDGEGDAAAETEVAIALTASNINDDDGVISVTEAGNDDVGDIAYTAATYTAHI